MIFQMQKKKTQRSNFKISKVKNIYFTREPVMAQTPSVLGGAIYDKHPTLTTSVW